ncbi:MAG: serine/threonine-protein kinase [Pseudomonadota bacterium]
MEPKAFGRYRVTGKLGRGAMGTVYRAVDPVIEREVAIKTLLPNLPQEVMDEVRERFLREARSAGRMNHPNVVTIFDVGEQDGVAWIAMEILAGRSLQKILHEEPRLPFERIADLAAQIADALDYAAELGIVHRDVKPANIMVDRNWRAKLVDFGIAHVPSSTMTQTGAALGSPRYMSPEQVLGLPVDPRADIFSLGVVLYEMLAGRTPFDRPGDTTIFALMNRIAAEPHPPVRSLDPAIPELFERILDRALAKKPGERYARAGEMAAELRAIAFPGAAASATGAAEKTVALGPAARRPDPAREARERDKLLADLEAFARNFEAEQQAQLRAEEEERRRRQEALERWSESEAQKRAEFERRQTQAAAQGATSAPTAGPSAASPERRGAALELLRRKAAERPASEHPARRKAERDDVLDRALRGAFRYLAEFVKELNEVMPVSGLPYDYLYLGKLPPVTLSDAFVDVRPLHVHGRDFCDHIVFRYKITLSEPVRATVLGADIGRLEQMLKAVRAPFEMRPDAKDDFGRLTRATFTVRGTLPCEAYVRGDYERGAASAELINVRRPGKQICRLELEKLESVADDLARYVLGADDDFARLFAR